MNTNRIKSFFLAGVLGVASGTPMSAHADDTEIFTGGSAGEGPRPNVLFILDTSGSMSAFDGETDDRLDRMKSALNTLLDNVDNVNIGLMRFTDPGGPILFPVAGVDEDANAIDTAGQPDVNVRVSNNADDAEELVTLDVKVPASPAGTLGTVLLDGMFLELGQTRGFGRERSAVLQLANGAQDAEQSSSFYNNNSTVLEMVDNGGAGIRTTGYVFDGFPADTDNAVVVVSQLALTPRSNRSGPLTVRMFGRVGDNMPDFPGGRNSPGGCPVGLASQDTYCRLGLTAAADYSTGLNVTNLGDFQAGGTPGGNISSAIVDWNNVPSTITNSPIFSPDISPILEEIFALPGWRSPASNDSVGLFYTGTTASYREIRSYNEDPTRAAVLTVNYHPSNTPSGRQLVALRFRDVKVPQGSVINTASLELYAAGQSTDAADIRISAEKVVNAPVFQAGSGLPVADRLSGRLAGNGTTNAVTWNIPATDPWAHEEPVITPNISTVIKEVTDQGSWCGGNDIVVFLEYTTGALGTRTVHAHDADPSLAATLRLDYDSSGLGAGQGCTTETVTRQVMADKDDAEENDSNGTVWLTSSVIEMTQTTGTTRVNGFIFRDLSIHPGATIESAIMEFTAARDASPGAATVSVQGELGASISEFQSSTSNISNRINGVGGAGTVSVSMTMPAAAVLRDDRFSIDDVSAIVSEVTSQGSWEYGDDIAFVFQGSGRVDLRAHDADPSKAATLKVKVRYNVGDVSAGGVGVTVPVRSRLKEIVDDLTHEGYTPIVDTLWEAYRYYAGQSVLYGARRGTGGSSLERNTRLSHPGSYEKPPGVVSYPNGCNPDDSNLSAEACRGQTIGGTPNYITPIEEDCQANFIVLLTDGFANHNNSAGLIPDLPGFGPAACESNFSNGDTVSSGEMCGVDLVRYLNNPPDPDNPDISKRDGDKAKDLLPDTDHIDTVSTYTIGFNISTQFLKDMATEGGGIFYEATSAAQLAQVFADIISDVTGRSTSFAAPSLSINAFNRLEDRNDVYFSLFAPEATARWNGNIKHFKLCASEDDLCGEVGDILDATEPDGGLKAVDDDGRILDTALSFWSASTDGPRVLEGGAGQRVPRHDVRNVYTFVGNNLTLTGNDSFVPPIALDELIDTGTADGVIDSMTGGTLADRMARTEDLLVMGGASPGAIQEHVDWIRGEDVDNQFPKNDAVLGAPENRYDFSDPLHANPLAITFGGTNDDPVVKLVAGTNDGGIRLINTYSGKEEWIFYPPDMLGIQGTLRANPSTGHVYGMDGTPTLWINDTFNADTGAGAGVIAPADGDFVRVFVGQRRGGNHYYGLELEPPSLGVTDKTSTVEIQPKLMWSITGGTQEFARLGQSWSRPFLATMLVGTNTEGEALRKRVLIFTGGYEDDQDGGFTTSTAFGNAIYVVDAETGDRLYVISGPNSRAEHGLVPGDDGGTEVTDMIYPIPSDVAAFDSDGDNAIDRLYVGDVGGQVFRVDFNADRREDVVGITAVVGMLAELSEDTADADKRKIFYPPTVVQIRGVGTDITGEYDLVGIVTGNRANPLNLSVHDRFYGLRDKYLARMTADDTDNDGLSDDYQDPSSTRYPIDGDLDGDPSAVPPVAETITGDLLDITNIDNPLDEPDDILKAFNTGDGYYIRLQFTGPDDGEKALAGPTTLAGKLFFTTYLPKSTLSTACKLAEGRGLLYAIDAVSGAAIFNWWDGDDSDLTHRDRVETLGSGIPSSPVGVFLPEKVMLLIGIGGGAKSVDPLIGIPRERTYWFEAPPS